MPVKPRLLRTILGFGLLAPAALALAVTGPSGPLATPRRRTAAGPAPTVHVADPASPEAQAAPWEGDPVALQRAYGQLPQAFEANCGQADEHVQFLAHGRGHTLFLTPAAATLALQPVPGRAHRSPDGAASSAAGQPGHKALGSQDNAGGTAVPPVVLRLPVVATNP